MICERLVFDWGFASLALVGGLMDVTIVGGVIRKYGRLSCAGCGGESRGLYCENCAGG